MYAAVRCLPSFTKIEIDVCLYQSCEQTAGFKLDDPGRDGFDSSRNKIVRVTQVSDLNVTGRAIREAEIPCFGSDVNTRSLFQVVDDRAKLLITTGSTQKFDTGTVFKWPFAIEGVSSGTTDDVITTNHQLFQRIEASNFAIPP